MKTEDQFDSEAEKLIVNIQQAAWSNTPEMKRKTVGNNYPKEIKELVAEKRKARKKWHRTRDPKDKKRLKQLTKQLSKEIEDIKDESISFQLKNLTSYKDSDYSLWKATKTIKKPITQIPPIKTEDGRWARDNKDKAKVFANHLEKSFTNEDFIGNENSSNMFYLSENIKPVTPKEVAHEIKANIIAKKAPGFALITGEILKHLPRKGIVKLTNLINASFRLKYVPSVWKVAKVIMITKPGKPPNEVTSYRPISLLPIISKLFEKLLLRKLKPIKERKKLKPTRQFGFRNKHSTIDQVHRITNLIEKALEENKVCSTAFLDVAQAFDKVNHKALKHKLDKYLPKQYSKLLNSYIKNRKFRIKQENEYSELKEIHAGVPQGSVLGPVLYLLYTCDIPQPSDATIATFADDTAILAIDESVDKSTTKLQKAIDQINKWTKKWSIKLNDSKSIHVNYTYKKDNYLPVMLDNNIIPYANSA